MNNLKPHNTHPVSGRVGRLMIEENAALCQSQRVSATIAIYLESGHHIQTIPVAVAAASEAEALTSLSAKLTGMVQAVELCDVSDRWARMFRTGAEMALLSICHRQA